MSGNERMAVNSAIEELVSGSSSSWQKTAQVIINFGIRIPGSSTWVIRMGDTSISDSQDRVSGYAQGHGNVEVPTDKKSEHKEWTSAYVERVGYYRMIHHAEKRCIRFVHYRESDAFKNPFVEGPVSSGHLLSYGSDSTATALYEVTEVPAAPIFQWAIRTVAQMMVLWLILTHGIRRMFLGDKRKLSVTFNAIMKMPVMRVVYSARGQEVGQEYVGHVPRFD